MSKSSVMPSLDHVAVLVNNLEHSLESIRPHGWPIGETEEFHSEGTVEVYIGPSHATGRLLLIQAAGAGPYREAMEKRGPGLHHVALDAPDVNTFLGRVSGSGWYLHPVSFSTYRQSQTIWLSRPGVPMLVEVVEKAVRRGDGRDHVAFVERVEVPLPLVKPEMADALGSDTIVQNPMGQGILITIGGNTRPIEEFVEIDG